SDPRDRWRTLSSVALHPSLAFSYERRHHHHHHHHHHRVVVASATGSPPPDL
ncbi:hypothetical protein TorRG33x02_178220, partial [Trema orientale]